MLRTNLTKIWFTPVLGALMKNRTESLVICGAAAIQVTLTFAHLPGWPCPILEATGIPCPGCGLSTACALLFHGQWQESIQTHAFAPLFILGLLAIGVVCLLPETIRQKAIQLVSMWERQTGLAAWFLVSLFLYWGLRLFKVV